MSSRQPGSGPLDVVFRPGRFLATRPAAGGSGVTARTGVLVRALAYLASNLVLYAVPVAVSYGAVVGQTPLDAALYVAYPFLLLTAVTTWGFHAAVVVTGNSRGLVASVQTVCTTAGTYLALALGFAFPVLVGQGAFGEFLRGATMYLFVFSGEGATAPTPGRLAAIGAAVAACYYAYSLYLAARIRHGASRFGSAVVGAVALCSPVAVYPWLVSATSLPALLAATPTYVIGGLAGAISAAAVLFDLLRRNH